MKEKTASYNIRRTRCLQGRVTEVQEGEPHHRGDPKAYLLSARSGDSKRIWSTTHDGNDLPDVLSRVEPADNTWRGCIENRVYRVYTGLLL